MVFYFSVGNLLQSDVYKVAHHGASDKANSQEFLNAIKPAIAIISSKLPSGKTENEQKVIQEEDKGRKDMSYF